MRSCWSKWMVVGAVCLTAACQPLLVSPPDDATEGDGTDSWGTGGGTGWSSGGGTFPPPPSCPQGAVGTHGLCYSPWKVDVNARPRGLAVADLDGSGSADIVVVTSELEADTIGGVEVFLHYGTLGYHVPLGYQEVGILPRFAAAADIDGDDLPDVVVPLTGGSANLARLIGAGDGDLDQVVGTSAGSPGWDVKLRDVDLDGAMDAVVANFDSDRATVIYDVGSATPSRVSHDVGDRPTSVEAADMDGDGDLDLVVANNGTNDVTLVRLTPERTAEAFESVPAVEGPMSLAVADLDGNGTRDIAVVSFGGDMAILSNDGAGFFELARAFHPVGSADTLRLADLDDDGAIDIAITDPAAGIVRYGLNAGDWSFGTFRPLPIGERPEDLEIVAIDGRGPPDIIAVDADLDQLVVLRALEVDASG